jgi:hypothetical protein
LRKLNAIDPTILKVKEARLLQPVNAGIISNLVGIGFMIPTSVYTVYLWRTRGFRGFGSIAVLPIVGLYIGRQLTNEVMSYTRDYLYSIQRKELVENYKEKFGEKYLLSILDPSFRLK